MAEILNELVNQADSSANTAPPSQPGLSKIAHKWGKSNEALRSLRDCNCSSWPPQFVAPLVM